MADLWDERDGGRHPRRVRRRRRRRGRKRDTESETENPSVEHSRPRSPRGASTRSPEEQAYRDARRRANAKISFFIHLVAYGSVISLILFTAGFRPAFYTALSWGIGLSLHYFVAVVAPDLRRKMIEREVEHRVSADVIEQRRRMEGQHARSLEELSASIAHEIRNPITAAKSLVQQMGEDTGAEENVEYAHVALEELDRVERSVAHLLRYAREEAIEMQQISMTEVVESALSTFQERLNCSSVELIRQIDGEGNLRGDPEKLRRVIINLVGNSLDALEGGATPSPTLRIETGENLAGTEVWVRVRDNGPGISPEQLPKIFKPFYTSKSNGTGLGLAVTKKVMDAHGGSIEANSTPGEGCEFVLTLPKNGHSEDSPT